MTLQIHDTATRVKRPFEPRDPKAVGMYVCGPTVYDRIHIGNARPLIVFDVLYRLLKTLYPSVKYVRNITDVDDKINARAAERGIEIGALTAETIGYFHEDSDALGCLPPDVEPRATETIPEIVALIERLIDQGHAYALDDGHVLFHVPSWPDYGRFANKDRDEQISGARVDVASYKRDPADFVLWKPSDGDQPGWPSPWCAKGRPGWHIECSAMSEKHLGADFDIHGGGLDLVFPHHQNEIAQSCCAHPPEERADRFAKYWMHNGYVMSEGEKMSKSLGNFYTVRELLDEFPGEALRLVILKTHYRSPLDFSKEKLREAKAELDRLYGTLRAAKAVEFREEDEKDIESANLAFFEALTGNFPIDRLSETTFDNAETTFDEQKTPFDAEGFLDDLNTPVALQVLHGRIRQLNLELSRDDRGSQLSARRNKFFVLKLGELLGLLQENPEEWFKRGLADIDPPEIERLVEERKAAKKSKDFVKADRIRSRLFEKRIFLKDVGNEEINWHVLTEPEYFEMKVESELRAILKDKFGAKLKKPKNKQEYGIDFVGTANDEDIVFEVKYVRAAGANSILVAALSQVRSAVERLNASLGVVVVPNEFDQAKLSKITGNDSTTIIVRLLGFKSAAPRKAQ